MRPLDWGKALKSKYQAEIRYHLLNYHLSLKLLEGAKVTYVLV